MHDPSASIAVTMVFIMGTTVPIIAGAADSTPKLSPGHRVPTIFAVPAQGEAVQSRDEDASGPSKGLPTWSRPFTVEGKPYSYTLIGTDPSSGPAVTSIPTLLVPIRLTVPDFLVNGSPLVLDATSIMKRVLDSPIFTASKFDSGRLQFADAMLHAEFPHAPKGWDLVFTPQVGTTLDVEAPPGSVDVRTSKSGQYLAIANGTALDAPIAAALKRGYPQTTYVVFVSYNSLDGGAFGYHSTYPNKGGAGSTVFTYTSWLEDVNDLFKTPSPDADTFAHEISEVVHDAYLTSRTKTWGDPFGGNKCFQAAIETGDAVEDAPAKVQNYRQMVDVHGRLRSYTLQTEAMLSWFTRESPSSALHGAYSFPGEMALLGPAPLTCRR